MTVTEGLEKIKVLLGVVPAVPAPAPEPEQKLTEDIKTIDGQVLTVDKREVGANVLIAGVAAPDAEYTLEDGTVLTVVGGLVAEIASKAEVAPELEPPAPMDMSAFKAEFESFKADFGSHKEAFAAVQTELASSKEAFAALLQVVEAISNSSVQAPTQAPQSFIEMTPLQKFRATK